MAENQATFDISLKGDLKAQSREAANALSELKTRLKDNQDAVEDYRAKLKALRSQSGDTTNAQRELKEKLDALKKTMGDQRAAASGLRDKLGELRAATKAQSASAKEAQERAKALETGMRAAGGPVQAMREHLKTLREALGGGNAGAVLFAGGMALLVAAVAAASAAIVGGVVSLGKWAIGAADTARSLGLLQEATAGSAENSAAMTSQIDAMARRVPTARAELQQLYQETFRLANNSRMSGAAIQSTYEAIAQSSAAMGDSVGHQIGDLITRSKELGVVRIGRLDVQGTGLDYEKDLVAPLAKAMAKAGPVTAEGMNKARAQLAIGGLQMDAGAKFLADAVNKRFGSINLRQLLSLDVQWRRLKETFVEFTRGIHLEPLLEAVQHFFAMFNTENDVGAALKTIVEVLGNGIVDATAKGGPAVESFFKDLVIGAQELVIASLEGKESLLDLFKVDAKDLVADLRALVALLKGAAQLVRGVGSVVGYTADAIIELGQRAGIGGDSPGGPEVKTSPAHATGGVVGRPAPGEFWASVAPGETIVPAGASIAGGGGGQGGVTVNVTIHATGKGGEDIAKGITDSSFRAQLLETLTVALGSAGIQVPT